MAKTATIKNTIFFIIYDFTIYNLQFIYDLTIYDLRFIYLTIYSIPHGGL